MHRAKPTTETCLEQVRAKTIPRTESVRRVSPAVTQARETISALWSRSVQRHASAAQIGAQLWVSETTVRAWGDPRANKTVDLADLLALVSGRRALVLDVLDGFRALLEAAITRPAQPRDHHVRALVAQMGAVIVAQHDTNSPTYRRAVAALMRRAAEALEDDERGGP